MLSIPKLSPLEMLQTVVQSARMSGENHLDTARDHLMLMSTKFTDIDMEKFLNDSQRDKGLIGVVLDTHATSTEYALTILEEENFDEMLCISAGNANCDNNEFIFTLLTKAYDSNTHRAMLLTQRFARHLSQDGAACLQNHTDNHPKMCQILKPILMMSQTAHA